MLMGASFFPNSQCPPPASFAPRAALQALVERYLSVEVEGLTPEGLPIKLAANGWKARILQHECDHLAGVLVRRWGQHVCLRRYTEPELRDAGGDGERG